MASSITTLYTRLLPSAKRMLLLLAPLILASCATRSVETDFTFTPDSETGLVVGSASSEKKGESWYDALVRFYYIRSSDKGKLGGANTGYIYAVPPVLPLGTPGPSDFADSDGSVFAVELAPGDYELHKWEIEVGAYAIIYPVDPVPLPFTVKKGQATYIGNLHMYFLTGRNIIGLPSIADGRPVITDRSERDIPLLLQRYPKLKREEIEIDIIDDRPWGGEGPPERIEARLAN